MRYNHLSTIKKIVLVGYHNVFTNRNVEKRVKFYPGSMVKLNPILGSTTTREAYRVTQILR